jgi:hypothetical protein
VLHPVHVEQHLVTGFELVDVAERFGVARAMPGDDEVAVATGQCRPGPRSSVVMSTPSRIGASIPSLGMTMRPTSEPAQRGRVCRGGGCGTGGGSGSVVVGASAVVGTVVGASAVVGTVVGVSVVVDTAAARAIAALTAGGRLVADVGDGTTASGGSSVGRGGLAGTAPSAEPHAARSIRATAMRRITSA